MGIYGNIWEYMGIYGNIWEYMGIYGNIWEYDIFTMGIHQTLLDIMGTICIYIYIHICTMGINRIYQYHESTMGFGD